MCDNLSYDIEDMIEESFVFSPIALQNREDEEPREIFFVYHGGCADGFTAAYFFYLYMKSNPPTRKTKVTFVPEAHNFSKTKDLLKKDLSDIFVIFADICPDRELLIAVHEAALSTHVYDHHVSAERKCGDLEYCFFDMKRSGCGIIWDIFINKPRHLFANAVEAGDIWKQKTVPNCDEILIVLGMNKKTIENWTAFHKRLDTNLDSLIREGAAYVAYKQTVIRMLQGRNIHKLTIAGITMPAVNSPVFRSEVGNALVIGIGPCSAVWSHNGKYLAFSLRSEDKGPDVSKIAEKFGGGGHHNAAGFRVDRLEDLNRLGIKLDSYTEEELNTFSIDTLDELEEAFTAIFPEELWN